MPRRQGGLDCVRLSTSLCDTLLTANNDFGHFLADLECDCEKAKHLVDSDNTAEMEAKLSTLATVVASADEELESIDVLASFKSGINCSVEIAFAIGKFTDQHLALQEP